MADYTEDLEILPVQLELVGCLAEEIVAANLPAPCRVAVMPGDAYVLDFGPDHLGKLGNGQAWVRLVNAGVTFPGDAVDTGGLILTTKCGSALAYQFEVGISRCESAGTSVNGKFIPPTEQDQVGAVRLYAADRTAMKRAILCCLPDKLGEDVEIGLGLYQPIPSDGGMGGGTWQVFVRRT